ncbi:MAG: hypothetical protein AAGA56_01700, partial [Myxococcota bacterium]
WPSASTKLRALLNNALVKRAKDVQRWGMSSLPRRALLTSCSTGLVLAACGEESTTSPVSAAGLPRGRGGGDAGSDGGGGEGGGVAPLTCTETAVNIEGPCYRSGAPQRDDRTTADTEGDRITLRGRVLTPGCEPLVGAELDFWQADAEGRYDNDGVDDPEDGAFVLRGRVLTNDEGRYTLRTIVPGRYLNGAQFRPAHIHVKVVAAGLAPLTTQLYFEGDPFNEVDAFILESLIMPVRSEGGELAADFDFVLAPPPA